MTLDTRLMTGITHGGNPGEDFVIRSTNIRAVRYIVCVSLTRRGTNVYRLLSLPGGLYLDQLSRVSQISFGWKAPHLYEFLIAGKVYASEA